MITDWLFYLVAIPAVLLTGISKGGFGGALGGIAVPLMALAISPVQAAGIMLPILCLMDLFSLKIYFGKWDNANLKIMIPGALLGIMLGTLTFGTLDEHTIRLVIGTIAVAFTLNAWFGFAARQAPAGRSVLKGTVWSSVSGYTSFIAHAGGPPVMIYLLPQQLDKIVYVATVNFFFLIVNAIKIAPYAWLGQFTAANLLTALALAPLVPLGVWFGFWLQTRVNQKWFYRVTQIGVLLTGLQLIYQGTAER
ncbi:MAG TPA: sulfite exporter TauE/SafE family protein [Burkholderiales bacterium]|nr:sulfite exporter TauE/SafE family protein [Burkholderiales bacterium]